MASLDKLVIQITGDASGLTEALSKANKNLTSFNTKIISGNAAIDGFIKSVNAGASSAAKLSETISSVKTSFGGLNKSIGTAADRVVAFGVSAKEANTNIKAFATQLAKLAATFEAITLSSKGAVTAINSLQRRTAALGLTTSLVNGNMRAFNRAIALANAAASGGGVTVNQYTNAVGGAGGAANRTAGFFGRLNSANVGLMEGFRRQVAQITALRTLVYQAAFWFGPLTYAIIKTNAEYENQMQLLKNLSGLGTAYARSQWAEQTRESLVKLAATNPFSLHAITDTFVQMKTVGLDPLNGQLQTIMDSLAAFGKGDQGLRSVGLALQEMVGKTAVSMKELRRQLGQQIPDAMKAMAMGLNLTMEDFYKKVQSGTLESKESIRKMLAELYLWHNGAAANMMMTWTGLFARLTTAWQNFVAKLEHPPGSDANLSFIGQMKKNLNDLMVFMNSPAGVNFAISVDQAMSAVARGIAAVVKFVVEWKDQIVLAAKIFAYMWGGKLVLGTIQAVGSIFVGVMRLIVLSVGGLRTAIGAAGTTATIFQATMRATAVTLGIAATEADAAAMSIGAIASAMSIAIGVAIALGAAIWVVVRALNAKTDAQKSADLASSAAQGRTWEGSAEWQKEKDRITSNQAKAEALKTGGRWFDPALNKVVTVRKDPVKAAALDTQNNKDVGNFNLKNQNTKNASIAGEDLEFKNAQNSPYAPINEKYDKLLTPQIMGDNKKSQPIEDQRNTELAAAAKKDFTYWYNKWTTEKDPNMKRRYEMMANERKADYAGYEDAYKARHEDEVDVKGAKKKKKKKTPRDPMEGVDNAFANTYERSKDLEHQLSDLTDGTETEFDAGAAREEGEARAKALGKNKDAIRDAIKDEKEYQHQLRNLSRFNRQSLLLPTKLQSSKTN
jgi:tape measure domain-containing protein